MNLNNIPKIVAYLSLPPCHLSCDTAQWNFTVMVWFFLKKRFCELVLGYVSVFFISVSYENFGVQWLSILFQVVFRSSSLVISFCKSCDVLSTRWLLFRSSAFPCRFCLTAKALISLFEVLPSYACCIN